MRGIENGVAPRDQLLQALHIIGHVAVGRRHHTGGPAHHMIAGEQRILFHQRIAHVIGSMAGGENAFDGEVMATDNRAITHHDIGNEVAVGAFLAFTRRAMRAKRIRLRAGQRLQRCGRRRMILVGMGDQDMADTLSRQCGGHGRDMLRQIRARIDHRDLVAAPDHIDAGAAKGESAGIGRQQPRHQRAQPFQRSVMRFQRAVEGEAPCPLVRSIGFFVQCPDEAAQHPPEIPEPQQQRHQHGARDQHGCHGQ